MIIVPINAPTVRSLNENEKRVYKLLREGKQPFDIAQILHIPYRASYTANLHDVPATSVQGIITSIREKGWNIPATKAEVNVNNEEEDDMSKYDPEIKKAALNLHVEGIPNNEIAERLGVNYKTIWKWVHDFEELQPVTCEEQLHNDCSDDDMPPVTVNAESEHSEVHGIESMVTACADFADAVVYAYKATHKGKEPAPSANDTSSEQKYSKIIIPSEPENVKPAMMAINPDFENAAKEMDTAIKKKQQHIKTPEWVIRAAENEIEAVGTDIDKINAQVGELQNEAASLAEHRSELQLWVSDVIKSVLGAE